MAAAAGCRRCATRWLHARRTPQRDAAFPAPPIRSARLDIPLPATPHLLRPDQFLPSPSTIVILLPPCRCHTDSTATPIMDLPWTVRGSPPPRQGLPLPVCVSSHRSPAVHSCLGDPGAEWLHPPSAPAALVMPVIRRPDEQVPRVFEAKNEPIHSYLWYRGARTGRQAPAANHVNFASPGTGLRTAQGWRERVVSTAGSRNVPTRNSPRLAPRASYIIA